VNVDAARSTFWCGGRGVENPGLVSSGFTLVV
jgi:hypothetical protein